MVQRTAQCEAPLCLMMLLTASRQDARGLHVGPGKNVFLRQIWSVARQIGLDAGLRQPRHHFSQSPSASISLTGLPVRPRTDSRVC